jgi:N-acetylmuramoyl-L-alanine amidase
MPQLETEARRPRGRKPRRRRRRRARHRLGLSLLTHASACILGVALAIYALDGVRPQASPPPAQASAPLDGLHAPPTAFDWRAHPPASFPIPPYARFLEDVTIVLDPGHVGQVDKGGGWKRGPTGLREAEVNLRVAQFLREFLAEAGARVVLTRDTDDSLGMSDADDLRSRAEAANSLRADLLLSIHHNAADSAQANYTTVFYHAGPDHSPASLSAARYVLAGLNDALRLEQHLACALVSDMSIYKSDGFAVLRHARVPAVLSEASFHSNPDEETRLRDPLYNRREAYGMFLGLARWAQAGLPSVRLKDPVAADGRGSQAEARGKALVVQLDDGLARRGGFGAASGKILTESLIVKADGQPVNHSVSWSRREITIPDSALPARASRLYVDFETIFGQHVLHPWIDLK